LRLASSVRKRNHERIFCAGDVFVDIFRMSAADWSGRRSPGADLLAAAWRSDSHAVLVFPDEDDLPLPRIGPGQFLVTTAAVRPDDFDRWTEAGHWQLWQGAAPPPMIDWHSKDRDHVVALAVAAAIRRGWVVSSGADSDDWLIVEAGDARRT
jgi:hypothetical protein